MSIDELAQRVRGEYGEMPGLRLTIPQASKLWHRDDIACREVLDQLVAEHFLFRTANGAYVMWPETRPAKASFTTAAAQRRHA
jgi:hypothetical protein